MYRPRARICDSYGPANAASGDHRRTPGKLVAAVIALLAVIGLGGHFGLSTWRLYLILIGWFIPSS
jgi:hypothetical protein